MPPTTAMANNFRKDVLDRYIAGKVLKVVLLLDTSTAGAGTSGYSPAGVGEIATGGGYTQGGIAVTPTTGLPVAGTAVMDFADVIIPNSTISARGALVYDDSTVGKPVIAVYDFGAIRSSSGADFIIDFPAAGATTSAVRIA